MKTTPNELKLIATVQGPPLNMHTTTKVAMYMGHREPIYSLDLFTRVF